MHELKIRVVMLTGDSRTTAEAVAHKLGIDEVIAEVLPQDKSKQIKLLQEKGRFVAMAGDRINDAPALAQAQVGIAMGTGTDVAMQRAGVTLVKGDLRGILRARQLSEATMKNIQENLFFAFFYNALGVADRGRGSLPIYRATAEPHDCRRCDEHQFGFRHPECLTLEAAATLSFGSEFVEPRLRLATELGPLRQFILAHPFC